MNILYKSCMSKLWIWSEALILLNISGIFRTAQFSNSQRLELVMGLSAP